MACVQFSHTQLCGIKTVVPEHFIDIDDELKYYDYNPKKLARLKKWWVMDAAILPMTIRP